MSGSTFYNYKSRLGAAWWCSSRFCFRRFTNINVGWPGSVHDARVLQNSTLFELAESGNLFPPAHYF
ncbi:hypothetical protein ANANG_G00101030 [Anguilla anguilla]|uniref:DDE Tnp4 domain-containing protein n=1 Tax=Anguilla anguilla TaxID=7936 RepID=A0A9D3S139_ANGAN|nr:hypothetical protein ANANG_G00101030 [Anguilla anguilla]